MFKDFAVCHCLALTWLCQLHVLIPPEKWKQRKWISPSIN